MTAELNRLDSELIDAADELRQGRNTYDHAITRAKYAALGAIAAGATEVAVAETLGVNRLTVRRWRGK